MKKIFKFVVELEIDVKDHLADDLDDLPANVCYGVGQYVMNGVINNDLCWEFDSDNIIRKVIAYPLETDRIPSNIKDYPPYRYEESVRETKLGILVNEIVD